MILFVVIITIYVSFALYIASLPGKAKDIVTEPVVKDSKEYLDRVYYGQNASQLVNVQDLNFLWNNIPPDVESQVPIAYNLSFVWPPEKGSRAKLTAFPYPKGGGEGWLINFIEGMASLLDNTADQVTFPGWLVSIYDPKDPNSNNYGKWLNDQLPWDEKKGPGGQPSPSGVYMEVTHACYAPPKYKYPTCDDGGYWLYLTAGSGVFWTSGNKCLVANNKIDAMFKLLETEIGMKFLANTKYKTPLDYLVGQLQGTGGGLSLIHAMRQVIDAMQKNTQIPTITAFRSMEKSSSFTPWIVWITYSVFVGIASVAMFIYFIISIVKSAKGERSVWITVAITFGVAILIFGLLMIWYFIISEGMLRGFGYMTLDMGLKISGLSLADFITAARSGKNMLANSLAMVQNFDFHLEELASGQGLDSIIFHAQPNKSGSWSVEIIDVRNTPFKDAKSDDDLIYKLGLCGDPLDGSATKMPPLMQGPIKAASDAYLGFQPTSKCNCDEAAVKKKYDLDGTLKKCVFCTTPKGETQKPLSELLC